MTSTLANYVRERNNRRRAEMTSAISAEPEGDLSKSTVSDASKVVIRLGSMMQSCGASAYRIKIAMARLARAIGASDFHSQVSFGEISSTIYIDDTFRTEIAEQRRFGTNAAQLDRLRHFVQHLDPTMTVAKANATLNKISQFGPEYSTIENMLASGFSCACFCFLNRGGLMECILAGIAATFGQALRKQMMIRRMNHFGVWLMCGLVAAGVYVALASLAAWGLPFVFGLEKDLPLWFTGVSNGYRTGIVSAVLFLVPGFPMITAMLDLVRTDLLAGISRITYVLMLVISAGVAVWLVSLGANWRVDPPPHPPVGEPWLYLIRMLCSFAAAFGFAMLFNSTRKLCLWAAIICAILNPLRFLGVDLGLYWQFAVGLESFAIGIFAHVISAVTGYRYSRVSLTVPAAVLMIPGVPLYAALTHMNQGNYAGAMDSLAQVSLVILGIGIGLASARLITDPGWRTESALSRAVRAIGEGEDAAYQMR
ncbi:MAG: threonine/serine exporter family protein [Actinomycetaceae bacterium]|nr:threonine/serine exporter family protein [Actinomycetaceae bacterium]